MAKKKIENNKPVVEPTESRFFTFGRGQSSEADFQEVINNKEWVSFGVKNDAPQEIIRLYDTASPLHTALIDKKVQMSSSAGFNQDKITTINQKLFFKNRHSKDNLDVIATKVATDLALGNMFYLNVVWNEDGTQIAQIDHVPFEKARAQKPTDFDQDRIDWFVSRNWMDSRKAMNKPVLVAGFSQSLAKRADIDAKSQILQTRVYEAGKEFYGLPSYKSSFNQLKSFYELGLFDLKSIQNGFSAGMMIIMKGEYKPEEQEQLHRDIKKNYVGADEAGDYIMMFAKDPDSVPDIIPIELQATAERFLNQKASIVEDIIQAHGATSPVAGREVSGKLGNASEIEEAHDLFQKTVISPMQKMIEDVINMLAEISGIEPVFELNKFDEEDVVELEAVDEEAKARASLKGSVGGVQGILGIQTSVAEGTTSIDAGAAILELIYGLDPEAARRMLGGDKEITIEENTNEDGN